MRNITALVSFAGVGLEGYLLFLGELVAHWLWWQ